MNTSLEMTKRRDPRLWRSRLRRMLISADALVIGVSSLSAYVTRSTLGETGLIGPLQNEVPAALGVLPLWLAVLGLAGCYRPHLLSGSAESLRRFLGATVVGVLMLGFASFLFNLQLSRLYVLFLFLLVLVLGSLVRFGFARYLRRRRARAELIQDVLIVGSDEEAVRVAEAMSLDPMAGYRVVGFVSDTLLRGTRIGGHEVVGGTDDILELASARGADLVVISPTAVEPGTLQNVTIALEGSLVDLAVAPSLFEVVTRRVTIESVANVPLLHVDQIRLTRAKAAAKRTVDVAVSSALLLVLWPVMLAAALAVRLEDRGPVLFRQQRVGRDGHRFTLLKFRTMIPDAEERLGDVRGLNEAGHHFFKIRQDPRVTGVGRFLRKWSIDETPQLWQVLRGDLSLVGPRPPLPAEVEHYEPWHLRRLRVKPGVTGIWQVSGRSNVPFNEAVRMDLFYIENWSLGLDVTILAKTVLAVLGRRGAW